MVALVSIRTGFDDEQNSSQGRSAYTAWWHNGWQAFLEWMAEPIPFLGKWPACNPSEQRYNRAEEAIQSSKRSLADVQ